MMFIKARSRFQNTAKKESKKMKGKIEAMAKKYSRMKKTKSAENELANELVALFVKTNKRFSTIATSRALSHAGIKDRAVKAKVHKLVQDMENLKSDHEKKQYLIEVQKLIEQNGGKPEIFIDVLFRSLEELEKQTELI